MARVTTLKELNALPVDSIVGKHNEVYQRIFRDDDPEVKQDGLGNPCVWAGIAFDNDPEYASTGAIWHRLAECETPWRHGGGATCVEHQWVDVWYEAAQ
jgi:hypothetical protein